MSSHSSSCSFSQSWKNYRQSGNLGDKCLRGAAALPASSAATHATTSAAASAAFDKSTPRKQHSAENFLRTALFVLTAFATLATFTVAWGTSSTPMVAQDAEIFAPPTTRKELRAVRTRERITLDGNLSEASWNLAPVASGFVQAEPNQGAAATFDTEVRVVFDDAHIYIAAFCRDTSGAAGVRVQNLQRDFSFDDNDIFGVAIDAFRSERNCLAFQVNPYGALRDLQTFDDAFFDRDWDAVWQARTQITDSGWTVEMMIPWETLRYPEVASSGVGSDGGAGSKDSSGVWGLNIMRNIRRLNQITGWAPWPRAFTTYRMTYAGLLTGLEPPPPRANVRVQPYAVARAASNQAGVQWQAGGEAKWAITPSTVLDLTVNTDFAQADVDRQVVNLRRFSVFFPERRQFFLEGASLFNIGSDETGVQPFFSRRIGLNDAGQAIPIDVGMRLLSQTTERSIGALAVRQRAGTSTGAANFFVGRYSQNFGSGSRLGGMVTTRYDEQFDYTVSVPTQGSGADRDSTARTPARLNLVGAADWFWRFSDAFQSSGMISYSHDTQFAAAAPDGAGSNASTALASKQGMAGYAWVGYQDNFFDVGHVQGIITPDYKPRVGFVGRTNLITTLPYFNINWRPAWKPDFVRAFTPSVFSVLSHGVTDRVMQEGILGITPVGIDFQSGAGLQFSLERHWQYPTEAFEPLDEMVIRPGSYEYWRGVASFNTDLSAPLSLEGSLATGGYFDGTLSVASATLRATPIPNIAFNVSYEFNEFRGVGGVGYRTTHLFAPQVRLALNPRLQIVGFYQYNTAAEQGALNARIAWEFEPLSFLFIVVNDNRSLPNPRFIAPFSRQDGVVKLSYLRQL
jgi:hypothetical protein